MLETMNETKGELELIPSHSSKRADFPLAMEKDLVASEGNVDAIISSLVSTLLVKVKDPEQLVRIATLHYCK